MDPGIIQPFPPVWRKSWRRLVKTKICITVDVEPSVAGALAQPGRLRPLLDEPVAGSIGGRSEGLGFLLRTLRDTGLSATFFVETLHTRYFGEGVMGRYVEDILADGHDVQLHVHPLWRAFGKGTLPRSANVIDDCAALPEARLIEILEEGKAQLALWTGTRPLALRTGNFSTSREVFRAMAATDLRVSSNICTGVTPPGEPSLRLAAGAHLIEGVLEFPVTCFKDAGPVGRNRWRGLQITACARWELKALLEEAHGKGYRYVVIVTHPFEFVKTDSVSYSKMTVNRVNQRRFRWLCEHLANNEDRFAVAPLAALAQEGLSATGVPHPEISGRPLPSLLRSAQNVLNDRLWAF